MLLKGSSYYDPVLSIFAVKPPFLQQNTGCLGLSPKTCILVGIQQEHSRCQGLLLGPPALGSPKKCVDPAPFPDSKEPATLERSQTHEHPQLWKRPVIPWLWWPDFRPELDLPKLKSSKPNNRDHKPIITKVVSFK